MDIRHALYKNKMTAGPPDEENPFRDHLLIAMPSLQADAFTKSVIYVCAHGPSGTMGIVLNQRLPEIRFRDLLKQFDLQTPDHQIDPIVHFGGPVETGRGFVLHSTDFLRDDTVRVNSRIGITGTIDILKAISAGSGPKQSLFALGYAGWGPGQLDQEMQANAWLTAPADDELIFDGDLAHKWEKALLKMGITPAALSFEAGHA